MGRRGDRLKNRKADRRAASCVLLVALAAVAVCAPPAGVTAAQAAARRTIFVTVTSKSGQPILDLRPEEFEVKERGKVQQIAARLTTSPLRVSLIVSDRGTGAFQAGALRFCEALLGYAPISIIGLIAQPERLVEDGTSGDALRPALQQLGRRAALNQVGAQLVETIQEVAEGIRRPGSRAAMVVMRAGNEASTTVRVDHVMDAVRKSGASLYVVSVTREGVLTGASLSNLTLETVLNDGARESGGRRIDVVGLSVVPTMQQIAAELLNQYEVSYDVPKGARRDERVSVSSTRRDVVVHAPSRVRTDVH